MTFCKCFISFIELIRILITHKNEEGTGTEQLWCWRRNTSWGNWHVIRAFIVRRHVRVHEYVWVHEYFGHVARWSDYLENLAITAKSKDHETEARFDQVGSAVLSTQIHEVIRSLATDGLVRPSVMSHDARRTGIEKELTTSFSTLVEGYMKIATNEIAGVSTIIYYK